MPIINYLPPRAALQYARVASPRVDASETWQSLLRRGIRGGTVRGIVRDIGAPCRLVRPMTHRGYVDLWYDGYVRHNHRDRRAVRLAKALLSQLERLTGLAIVPYLTIALRKPGNGYQATGR